MTNLDKFCSDIQRSVARTLRDGSLPILAGELERNFFEWTRPYGTLAENLWAFWVSRYSNSLQIESDRSIALDRLTGLMALLTGSFEDTMDFSNDEWQEIREIVSAEAESMNMDELMEIMSIIVSRGKI